jgi:hypothetical protein
MGLISVLTNSGAQFSSRIIRLVCMAMLMSTTACIKSPAPKVTELLQISPPIFDYVGGEGLQITPSRVVELTGRCDRNSYGLEYSLTNGDSWIVIPGACPSNGRFSFILKVSRVQDVLIRAKTKFTYTEESRVTVKYVLPPSSPVLSLVSSASSDDDEFDPSMANVMAPTFSGTPLASANTRLHTHIPGMVYAEQ